jgi:hypothetical protein
MKAYNGKSLVVFERMKLFSNKFHAFTRTAIKAISRRVAFPYICLDK